MSENETMVERLHRLYGTLLEGKFYEDYDASTAMLSIPTEAAAALTAAEARIKMLEARGAILPGFYIASKTAHGPRWRDLRAAGVPIISTWIDEAEAGATDNWPDLWHRCVREASAAAATIVYRERGEVLKGAFVEMGAALAAGRTVFAVGCEEFSVRHHMRVVPCASLDEALDLARQALTGANDAG